MRDFRRKVGLQWLLVFLLAVPSFAERSGDHSGPEAPPKETKEKKTKETPQKTATTKPIPKDASPPVRIITRQEALVEGLKSIKIERKALEELVKFTEENPNINPGRFSEVVDKIVDEQPLVVTRDQATELKDLFEKELGPVENSEVGTEFNLAAQRVLSDQEQSILDGNGTPPSGSPKDDSPIPKIRKAEGLESSLAEQFEKRFGENAKSSALEEKLNTELTKRLSKADQLLDQAESANNLRRDGAVGGKGGLLDALRGAIKDIEGSQKKDEKGPSPSDGLGDILKNAFAKNNAFPPPSNDDKKDDKKLEPPPPPAQKKEEKNPQLDALLAALKNSKKGKGDNEGNNNKNDKNNKGGEGEFSLPEPKEPKEEADKGDKKDSLLGGNEEQEEAPPDTQGLLDALKNAKGEQKKSPLSPIGGGGGNFFGGGGGGGFGGGGGGEMGPNIVGSASPPSGGSFDGDPFGGLGQGGFGGGGGKFSLAKKVEYGSGGGSNDVGGEEGSVGDFLDGTISALRKGASRAMNQLIVPFSKNGEKVMLLDYIGRLKETLCEEEREEVVAVCQVANAKKSSKALETRFTQ